jgi:YVTN family beta-propeller protein
MRQFRPRAWHRPRPLTTILIAALAVLVPVTISSADSAVASPSPGYAVSLIPTGEVGEWAAVNPDTNTAYVGDTSADEISVVDGDTNTVTATIALGAQPHGIAVDAATNTV